MLTEGGANAALKLASIILEEYEQYGTLKTLVPLAESILGTEQTRFMSRPTNKQPEVVLQT